MKFTQLVKKVITKVIMNYHCLMINPFVLNSLFLHPLKTSENLPVFRVVEKGCIEDEWGNYSSSSSNRTPNGIKIFYLNNTSMLRIA